MTNKVNWQGSFDALCGVYCAAHLIACYAVKERATRANQSCFYEDRAKRAFSDLLSSLEDLGLLKAYKICLGPKYSGYTDRQIEKAINHMSENSREGLAAIAFSRPHISHMLNSERRGVLAAGACAIVQEHAGDHWITAEGKHRDGGYCCFDPDFRNNTRRRTRLGWKKGIFVGYPDHWNA